MDYATAAERRYVRPSYTRSTRLTRAAAICNSIPVKKYVRDDGDAPTLSVRSMTDSITQLRV